MVILAVAPMAIARAIQQLDVKPEMISGEEYFKRMWGIGADGQITWYRQQELEHFLTLEQMEMKQKLLAHYGNQSINKFFIKTKKK